MGCHDLCDSASAPAALQSLFRGYRNSLPPLKQELVSDTILNRPRLFPGLVGYEDGEPAVAVLWRFLDPKKEVATVDLYVESPTASAEVIEKTLSGFVKRTEPARAICFEVWTAPGYQIHDILPRYGFTCRKRQLMELCSGPSKAINCNFIHFRSFKEIELSLTTLESLAELLCQGYAGTRDAEFYEHFYTQPHCQNYLLQALASPFLDYQNSLLAAVGPDGQPVGLVMCFHWPHARTLYIEQLAVHRRHHGRGIGRALLSQVLSGGRNAGIARVLLTVSDDNDGARHLYERAGFSLVQIEYAYLKRA